MNNFYPRRRQQEHVFPSKYANSSIQPRSNYFYEAHNYSTPNFVLSPSPHPNMPSSPPPPYQLIENNYIAAPRPAPFYQQPYQSQPYLPPLPPRPPHNLRPPWESTGSLTASYAQPVASQEQALPRVANLHSSDATNEANDCPIARSMNQGAAFCDRVASILNDVLSRIETENTRGEDIEALTQGLTIEVDDHEEDTPAVQRVERSRKLGDESKIGIINFKKTWMYANSRLPPEMLPFKVYMPTWSILCRAADASAAVYQRPRGNESEEYVEADWRQGTKAMALKSACIDEKNLIVFAIRGSKWNLMDWAVNFRPAPKEPVGFLDDQGNACHAGFLQVARAMIRPVAAKLRQLLEQDPGRAGSSLVITGHSAGGAVASLLFMHMLSTRVESDLNILTGCFRRVHCITFGAPPVTLLPLQKPSDARNKKNLFMAFANEGDPVVRADKQYIYSLGRLIAAPAPDVKAAAASPGLLTKKSRQKLKLKPNNAERTKGTTPAPIWPVPAATLSNAGRLVLLRKKPAQRQDIEAVSVSDEQLRDVIFGDPSMHDMALYKRRIDELAVAAVTGRD